MCGVGQAACGICQSYLAQKELSCEPIWEFTGVLLMARSHPLASFGAVTSDGLADYVELRRGNETALGFFEEPQQEDTGIRIYGCVGAGGAAHPA